MKVAMSELSQPRRLALLAYGGQKDQGSCIEHISIYPFPHSDGEAAKMKDREMIVSQVQYSMQDT